MKKLKCYSKVDYSDEIYEAIRHPLLNHRSNFIGSYDPLYNGLCLYDAKNTIQGGILGQIGLGRLFIQNNWVNEAYRGQGHGSQLLKRMEEWAKEDGATISWLCTTEYLALDFYKKRGYTVFGELPFHNINQDGVQVHFKEYFMQKLLV